MNISTGKQIIAVTGNIYRCADYTDLFYTLFLFNTDHSRYNNSVYGIDWTIHPLITQPYLIYDWTKIQYSLPNVVIGDLEFDDFPEFIYRSVYDGHLHCFTIKDNINEIYNWPFKVDNHETDGYYTFASEATIVYIDNDGYAELYSQHGRM